MEHIVIIGNKLFEIYYSTIQKKLETCNKLTVKTRGKNIGNAVYVVTSLESKKLVKIKSVKLSGSIFVGDDEKTLCPRN